MNYRETNAGVEYANKKKKCTMSFNNNRALALHDTIGRGYVVIFIRIESKWNYI